MFKKYRLTDGQEHRQIHLTQKHYLYIYVTAAGCGPVIPVITFVLTGDVHRPVYALGHYSDLVRDGYRILFTLGGRHALTSLKGGGPCPLSTLNYEIAGHLAYR